jgi:flagellar biosynthetic protein FliQ
MELTFLEVASRGIQTALYMAAPVLGLALLVGFIISIFQAVTSIQEQTLTFVPKIFVTGLAIIFFGPWLSRNLITYASDLFGHLHLYVR